MAAGARIRLMRRDGRRAERRARGARGSMVDCVEMAI